MDDAAVRESSPAASSLPESAFAAEGGAERARAMPTAGATPSAYACSRTPSLYSSTYDALNSLYPKLSQGGFLIVDDFLDWSGCREAVYDYRKEQGIDEPIVLTPHRSGEAIRSVYWRK